MAKKTKCYSVRLKNLTQISPKCWKAEDWQGNKFLIPDSQYFGQDYDVSKSEAHWLASWLIDKEDCNLMVSTKKIGWYNPINRRVEPNVIIEVIKTTPAKVEFDNNQYPDESLIKQPVKSDNAPAN